ncbi:MAG: thiamine pyrophosphate-dependent enzyme [Coriobacteriia bacterium]|nr:thiamine pyrophosphate-dependent enzyme [Coriobacteriia bacterium]
MTKKLLMGNEAFAHAALEAGVRVVAGYPGTPSSELVETVAKLHAQGVAEGVHVEWSTNEKAALELLCGASYTGARSLFTCKQMGLNVAADALLSVNYVGVKGGLVLFVCDDPGPISSQTEQDTRRFAAFAKVPVLDPATPDQGFAMMQAAFDLSERYKTPVIVRPTTRIDHASTYFDVADRTQARPVPEEGFEKDPKWIIFPKRSYAAHAEINERLACMADDFGTDPVLSAFNPQFTGGGSHEAAGENAGSADNASADIADAADNNASAGAAAPKVGIVAGGVSAAYAREALAMLEQRAAEQGLELPAYKFMQIGTPYPFPQQLVADFAEGLDAVLVLEELDYVIEEELLRLAGMYHLPLDVYGKLTGSTRDRGENDVDDAAERIARFFDDQVMAGVCQVSWHDPEDGRYVKALSGCLPRRTPYAYEAQEQTPLPVRPPVLCAGCPHRGSFYAVKRALGKRDAVYCGDIGCYTLGNAAPLHTTDTCLCMGAGITMAQGFAVAEPHKKQVAFVGDSTFFASGLTGCANAVYNQHDITVCVLDNATTAMTGSQPHPGTGQTLMGPKTEPISIEAVLQALGFKCIVKANPLNLDESIAAAQQAIDFEGPSAILFQQPCIQLKKPDPALVVDDQTCTGCKQCVTEIGCPAVGFDPDARGPLSKERGQACIDASLCDGCGLCAQICKFGSIKEAAHA